jgi:multiple sugar transport system permease protein
VLSVAVVSLLWWWIFQSEGGLLNYYLGQLHLETPQWLSTLPWAWVAILVATVWWTLGFNMIILLAALQDIPDFLYEAASIDGATRIQQFFRITVPMLQPVLLFIVTTSIIASFNLFGQPFFMTGGGPSLPQGGGATTPVMVQIYNEGFVRHFQGSASAMSFVVAAIMIIVSYLNFRIFRQRED